MRKILWESACWATGAPALREDHRVLPTTGDRVAAERPDRAGPTASDVIPAPRSAPAARTVPTRVPRATAVTVPLEALASFEPPVPAALSAVAAKAATAEPAEEPLGCLYALSQPPLMLFLLVIGGLLGLGAGYDLLFL